MAKQRRCLAWGVALGFLALLLPNAVTVWIDESGHTYLTDSETPPRDGLTAISPEQLSLAWEGEYAGEPLPKGATSVAERDRYLSAVFAARTDVRRGEMKRGLRTLRSLWRDHPSWPEAGYLLALVERHRGRLEAAHEVLNALLRTPAELPEHWRETALSLRTELEDEIAFARRGGGNWEQRQLESEHFRVSYDHQFAGREYGQHVVDVLERVRQHTQRELGLTLSRPLDVRLYTRAHYLDSYEHRFGFATVGFYDGTIHVVSARRPRRELFALLVHEYIHALFQEHVGGHQPFFLNEGIADREEERVRGRAQLAQGEWRELFEALRSGEWIPLGSLVQGFNGLKGTKALLAYLEARAAVELIETRFPGATGRWLTRCREGNAWERALVAETGWNTARLERALKEEIESRFISDPLVESAIGSKRRSARPNAPNGGVPPAQSSGAQ